jgi:pimeloyl-ACP methyl ester carboxylesterase
MRIPTEPVGSRALVAGTELFYHDIGTGPVLLCLHGGGAGATGWGNFFPLVEYLSGRARLVIVDLPGYGRSSALPDQRGGYEAHAEVIAGFIDPLGVDSVNLLGMATGGAIAAAISVLSPHLVDNLVLVSSAGGHSLFVPMPSEGQKAMRAYAKGDGPSREKMRAYLQLLIHDQAKVTEELVESRYQASIQGRAEPHHSGGTVAGSPLWASLRDISARTLIVWGRENRFQGFDNALFFGKEIPDSRVHIFAGTGLWVPYEQPDEFARLVEAFLGSPDGSQRSGPRHSLVSDQLSARHTTNS